jgi:cell division control protein 24
MTVKSLHSRVEDWKGHHLSNFGELLIDDIFVVTKSNVDREYHVFLFEKIILCCKEAIPVPNSAKKISKSNSILKKQQQMPAASPVLGAGAANRKMTPLLLKGRIFLNNVTKAVSSPPTGVFTAFIFGLMIDQLARYTSSLPACRMVERRRRPGILHTSLSHT